MNVNWCSHCGKQWGFLKKTKNRPIIWSSNSTPGYYPKKSEILNRRGICNLMFIAAVRIDTIAKIWKQPKFSSIIEWIKKMGYIYICIHTHNGILLSHERWNLNICNNMNGPRGYYDKWNKSDREKQYYMISLICGIQKTNKHNKIERVIDTDNSWWPEGREWGWKRNRWGRLRGVSFKLQNKYFMGMKNTVWGI